MSAFMVDCGRFRSVSLFGEFCSATFLQYVGCHHWPVLLPQSSYCSECKTVKWVDGNDGSVTWAHVSALKLQCVSLLMPMSVRGL